jgi:hypothetical protein
VDNLRFEKELQRQIDEYLRKTYYYWVNTPSGIQTFWPDAATSDDTPPARSCHIDGHVWVDTGMLRSWCKYCSEDAEWSRAAGCYKPRHQVARRYDA